MAIYKTTLEVDVIVHYEAHPFIKGSFESGGLQIEPDEPAHIEIDWVEGTRCIGVPVTDQQRADLCEEIAKHLADADEFAASEHDDRLRDERRGF